MLCVSAHSFDRLLALGPTWPELHGPASPLARSVADLNRGCQQKLAASGISDISPVCSSRSDGSIEFLRPHHRAAVRPPFPAIGSRPLTALSTTWAETKKRQETQWFTS